MSAVLRAYGKEFDVDAFLVGCALPVCAVKRRGEPLDPASKPNSRRHERSGVHVLVSDAEFEAFSQQVEDAIMFLRGDAERILGLCQFPGVEGVTLDFGIARRDVVAQCDHFPAELIRLAGSLGLAVDLSQYPIKKSVDAA